MNRVAWMKTSGWAVEKEDSILRMLAANPTLGIVCWWQHNLAEQIVKMNRRFKGQMCTSRTYGLL